MNPEIYKRLLTSLQLLLPLCNLPILKCYNVQITFQETYPVLSTFYTI